MITKDDLDKIAEVCEESRIMICDECVTDMPGSTPGDIHSQPNAHGEPEYCGRAVEIDNPEYIRLAIEHLPRLVAIAQAAMECGGRFRCWCPWDPESHPHSLGCLAVRRAFGVMDKKPKTFAEWWEKEKIDIGREIGQTGVSEWTSMKRCLEAAWHDGFTRGVQVGHTREVERKGVPNDHEG